MRSRSWKFRLAALLAVASFGVHQLRFVLAYGSGASRQLAHQGHAYLSVLAPLLVGVLMLAVAEFAGGLTRRRSDRIVPGVGRLTWVASLSLLCVYCLQELVEGMAASGHPDGLGGIFGGGGWIAIPLAVAAGIFVALLMRGAAAIEAATSGQPLPRSAPTPLVHLVGCRQAPHSQRLRRSAAARAPPLASI
jgi:hypothetical protein